MYNFRFFLSLSHLLCSLPSQPGSNNPRGYLVAITCIVLLKPCWENPKGHPFPILDFTTNMLSDRCKACHFYHWWNNYSYFSWIISLMKHIYIWGIYFCFIFVCVFWSWMSNYDRTKRKNRLSSGYLEFIVCENQSFHVTGFLHQEDTFEFFSPSWIFSFLLAYFSYVG